MPTTQSQVEIFTALFHMAIENGGYGQFLSWEYEPNADEPFAVIEFSDNPDKRRVGLATMAHGVGVIRSAERRIDERYPDDGPVLHNAATGQRLGLGSHVRNRILNAIDPDNHDVDLVDLDAIDALAVLECAIFGAVTYN